MSAVILVTDAKYRMAIALVQSLGEAGQRPFACQASRDGGSRRPPAFRSRYLAGSEIFRCGESGDEYSDALYSLCLRLNKRSGERTTILAVGAKTIALLAHERAKFEDVADFLVPDEDVLELANDKHRVAALARELGIAAPEEYIRRPGESGNDFLGRVALPAIVKPKCGEKYGLKAAERYRIAHTAEELAEAYRHFTEYEPEPVVQKLIGGFGVGVSVVMDREHNPAAVICHRRIREYPVSGGPSSCCESYSNRELIENTVRLLRRMKFTGIAMVEYRGDERNGFSLLEINPRCWGTFPLTHTVKSEFAERWVRAARGEIFTRCADEYRVGKRMNFLLSDGAASLAYLRAGKFRQGLRGLLDIMDPRVDEALFSWRDMRPFFAYLAQNIFRRNSGAGQDG